MNWLDAHSSPSMAPTHQSGPQLDTHTQTHTQTTISDTHKHTGMQIQWHTSWSKLLCPQPGRRTWMPDVHVLHRGAKTVPQAHSQNIHLYNPPPKKNPSPHTLLDFTFPNCCVIVFSHNTNTVQITAFRDWVDKSLSHTKKTNKKNKDLFPVSSLKTPRLLFLRHVFCVFEIKIEKAKKCN